MKKFKTIDAWISAVLIVVFITVAFTKFTTLLFAGYFVVGGWQVISMIIHAADGRFSVKGSKRYRYDSIVVLTIMAVLLGLLLQPLLFVLLYALLIFSPAGAVFYTWLCFNEVRQMNQRPLSILK